MKRWFVALGTVFALAAAWPASADRDWSFQDVRKRVSKLAVDRDSSAKVFCVCQDGGALHLLAGWLESRPDTLPPDGDYVVQVRCLIPKFATRDTQAVHRWGYCEEFEVLSK